MQQFILPSYREGEDWVAAPADEADGWPHGAPAVLALADRADPRYTWGDQPFHQQDWNKLILIHACARSCGCRLSPQMGHQQSRPQRRREAGSASLALVPTLTPQLFRETMLEMTERYEADPRRTKVPGQS